MNSSCGGAGGRSGAGEELIGLVIGALGALCVWMSLAVGGAQTGVGNSWGDAGGVGGVGLGWSMSRFVGAEWVEEEVWAVGGSVVVLVHGLDEPGGIWDEVAVSLSEAGFGVLRFDYPNDQAIGLSAGGFVEAMEGLVFLGGLGGDGIDRVDLVAHSMGGLVLREALTNPEMGGSSGSIGGVGIGRLILVGTPNEGSGWARLRGVGEVRERVQRWMSSEDLDLSILGNLGVDGDGQAGVDLLPGSDFLRALNARSMPESVAVTCVVGRVIDPVMMSGLGSGFAFGLGEEAEGVARALGDGVVSVDSATLDGCTDVVVLEANHRSLLRTVEFEEGWRAMVGQERAPRPAGIGVILDRLGREIE